MKTDTGVITVTHNGVTITYNESKNHFEFTLRGRDRIAESLAKAREFIDKPAAKDEGSHFTRISAHYREHDNTWKVLTVTSIAVTASWRSPEAWTVDSSKNRSMRPLSRLYPVSPQNDKIVLEIKELEEQRDKLKEQVNKLMEKLTPIQKEDR